VVAVSVRGVCETLAGLRGALSGYARELDPTRVRSGDAARLLAEAATLERLAAGLTAVLAPRAARSQAWQEASDRTPVHRLAAETGLPLGQAGQRWDTGRRLAERPGLAEAATSGEFSVAQLATVGEATETHPDAEAGLLELARRRSFGELQEQARRVAAEGDRDAAARHARLYARRSLRAWTDSGGVGHLNLLHTPEVVAFVMTAVQPLRTELARRARRAGQEVRGDALDADALVHAVCGTPTPAGIPGSGTAWPGTAGPATAGPGAAAAATGEPSPPRHPAAEPGWARAGNEPGAAAAPRGQRGRDGTSQTDRPPPAAPGRAVMDGAVTADADGRVVTADAGDAPARVAGGGDAGPAGPGGGPAGRRGLPSPRRRQLAVMDELFELPHGVRASAADSATTAAAQAAPAAVSARSAGPGAKRIRAPVGNCRTSESAGAPPGPGSASGRGRRGAADRRWGADDGRPEPSRPDPRRRAPRGRG
jgi:hypothetical protein